LVGVSTEMSPKVDPQVLSQMLHLSSAALLKLPITASLSFGQP